MAKRRKRSQSVAGAPSIRTALSAVVRAKATARGKTWSILHGVESQLARALRKRTADSHPVGKKKK
jgi:hypothetical protein